MQEEVESKAIHLVVRTTQLSARLIFNALRSYVQNHKSHKTQKLQRKNAKIQIKTNKRRAKFEKKYEQKDGKQSIKDLIRQGKKIDCMEVADLRHFKKIANKYGVDFAIVKDTGVKPPVYNCFFKATDVNAISQILTETANKYSKKEEIDRPSVLEKLEKFKEFVKNIPRKEIFKQKEQEL